jgi:hypothetical protein
MLGNEFSLLPIERPSFQSGFARCAQESAYPHLWKDIAGMWCPSIGIQGARLEDFSGHGKHGTFSAGMTNDNWVPSPWGWALNYDGVNNWINLGVNVCNMNGPFSIMARVWLADIIHNVYSVVGASVVGVSGTGYFILTHRADKSGFVWQYDTGPGATAYGGSPAVPAEAGKWYTLLMSYCGPSGSGIIMLQNSTLLCQAAVSPTFSPGGITQTWGIGAYDPINGINLFKGKIGDVIIWNRYLPGRECELLAQGNAHPMTLRFNRTYSHVLARPTVITASAGSITQTTATAGGDVTSEGPDPVTARGICWSTSSSPTTANAHTSDGSGPGAFSSAMTGLTAATLYHHRAYATNLAGTAYGSDLTFTTAIVTNFVIKYPSTLDSGSTAWNCGREPTVSPVRTSETKVLSARARAYGLELKWDGVSDAQCALFLSKVAIYADLTWFVLSDARDYVLDGRGSITARLVTYNIESRINSHTITATFEEVI